MKHTEGWNIEMEKEYSEGVQKNTEYTEGEGIYSSEGKRSTN